MKSKLLLLSLLVSYQLSFAQAQENEPIKIYKRDIGFNTTFLLQGVFNASYTPFTVMYKQYKTDHKAFRYGLNVSVNANTTNNNMSSYYSDYSSGYISVSIGKEIQKAINLKWVWYSGGDLAPTYRNDRNTNFQNGRKTGFSKSYSIGLGFRPFLGIRYNINSRLYVSAEASIQLQYLYNKNLVINYNNTTNTIERDTKGASYSLTTSPASGLFLFYRF